jgi:hypothetical protein
MILASKIRALPFRFSYCLVLFTPQPPAMVYFPHMAPKKPIEKPTKKRKATLDSVLSTGGRRRHRRYQKQDGDGRSLRDQNRLGHCIERTPPIRFQQF